MESALIEHNAVAEAAVVSSPDPVRGEVSQQLFSVTLLLSCVGSLEHGSKFIPKCEGRREKKSSLFSIILVSMRLFLRLLLETGLPFYVVIKTTRRSSPAFAGIRQYHHFSVIFKP